MFDTLTLAELEELSDKLCSAWYELHKRHSMLPGYAGIMAEIASAESEVSTLMAHRLRKSA